MIESGQEKKREGTVGITKNKRQKPGGITTIAAWNEEGLYRRDKRSLTE